MGKRLGKIIIYIFIYSKLYLDHFSYVIPTSVPSLGIKHVEFNFKLEKKYHIKLYLHSNFI